MVWALSLIVLKQGHELFFFCCANAVPWAVLQAHFDGVENIHVWFYAFFDEGLFNLGVIGSEQVGFRKDADLVHYVNHVGAEVFDGGKIVHGRVCVGNYSFNRVLVVHSDG